MIFLNSACVGVLRRGCRVSRASIVQSFQSESPSALLSEIGNPFSWTRFLASPRGAGEDHVLGASDCDRAGMQLGF